MQVVCVFKKAVFLTDSIVAMKAGPLVHVELLVIDSNVPSNSLSYTSYVGCEFGVSISTKQTYNSKDSIALAFDVTPDEHASLISYLHDLCESHIPYNYKDIAIMLLPKTIQRNFVDDVTSETPREIKALFCSQGIVLALRNSLSQASPLCQQLRGLNSRTVHPYALYHMLRPYTYMVNCDLLRNGEVKRTTCAEIV
jgi:hypothetical protein